MDEKEVREKLAALWEKYLPEMTERVRVLERACESLGKGKLSPDERHSALAAAHKLAGALGTFGRGHGTELAREIEGMLQNGTAQPARMRSLLQELRDIVGS
ncbi:MAG: Hpt domain-containing protein [Terriglobia bacterium]|jgi:HPt (histidine-containing phosphotransfer) domain-containing protein|nr:Hpt domain-containing protein [Terriglobia bacterium]